MKLKVIGSNQTTITLSNGIVILFSYNTPVAACLPEGGFIRTKQSFSKTTSKHINAWLNGVNAKSVEQSVLENLSA